MKMLLYKAWVETRMRFFAESRGRNYCLRF